MTMKQVKVLKAYRIGIGVAAVKRIIIFYPFSLKIDSCAAPMDTQMNRHQNEIL
jgi:hypothetical protein